MINVINNNWEAIFRILLASFCRGIIGYERTSKYKGAGLRTHIIVAMASGLLMVVSKYGFTDLGQHDGSRIAAQIVSGVGFLGAGVIFVKDKLTISGLTTAAGIWATAAIGMAVGSGLYILGFVSSILMVLINSFLGNPVITSIREQKSILFEIILGLDNDFDLQFFMEYNHLRLITIENLFKKDKKKLIIRANYYVDEFNIYSFRKQLEDNKIEYSINI